ncbi:MAG TPA: flagellar brake protein [Rhodocyclaceae bacterium]|nr:flagellar brake protein [Rhodocyclaceae bacterium]
MADNHQPEMKFELLKADDYTQYLLREKREIAFVLKQIIAKRANLTAYFGPSNRFLPTSLIAISEDDQYIFLDVSANEDLNEEALATGHLLCITQLDKVKIQFPLDHIERAQYGRFPTLKTALPDVLLRLQRREYYRLTAPAAHALTCKIPAPDGNDIQVEARVLDISGGGVAVVVPPRGVSFTPEMEFKDCRLDLPDFGPITANLRVRNIFRLTNRNGVDMVRAGCEFFDLSTPVANAIQRYILKVERERKAKELGE